MRDLFAMLFAGNLLMAIIFIGAGNSLVAATSAACATLAFFQWREARKKEKRERN